MSEAALRENLDKMHRWTFGTEGEFGKGVARELVNQVSDALAAQVVPQPDREALEAVEVPLPNGYQFVRLGKAGAAAVLAAPSPAPLTINRETLVNAADAALEVATARLDDTGEGFTPAEVAVDAVIAHLSAQTVEGEVEWGVRGSSGRVSRWSEGVARTLHAGAVRGGHENALMRRTVGPWVEVQS